MAKSPAPVKKPATPTVKYKIWDVRDSRYLRNDASMAYCDDIINEGDDSIEAAVKALQFVLDKASIDQEGYSWQGAYEIHEVVQPKVVKTVNAEMKPVIK